jgi:hypothetical protein
MVVGWVEVLRLRGARGTFSERSGECWLGCGVEASAGLVGFVERGKGFGSSLFCWGFYALLSGAGWIARLRWVGSMIATSSDSSQ